MLSRLDRRVRVSCQGSLLARLTDTRLYGAALTELSPSSVVLKVSQLATCTAASDGGRAQIKNMRESGFKSSKAPGYQSSCGEWMELGLSVMRGDAA